MKRLLSLSVLAAGLLIGGLVVGASVASAEDMKDEKKAMPSVEAPSDAVQDAMDGKAEEGKAAIDAATDKAKKAMPAMPTAPAMPGKDHGDMEEKP